MHQKEGFRIEHVGVSSFLEVCRASASGPNWYRFGLFTSVMGSGRKQ